MNQNYGIVHMYNVDGPARSMMPAKRGFSGRSKQCVHCPWLERVLSSDFLPGGTEGVVVMRAELGYSPPSIPIHFLRICALHIVLSFMLPISALAFFSPSLDKGYRIQRWFCTCLVQVLASSQLTGSTCSVARTNSKSGV